MDKLAYALEGQERGWTGAKYVRIDGSTDHRDRQEAVRQFANDPTVSVALLSITAAGAYFQNRPVAPALGGELTFSARLSLS